MVFYDGKTLMVEEIASSVIQSIRKMAVTVAESQILTMMEIGILPALRNMLAKFIYMKT